MYFLHVRVGIISGLFDRCPVAGNAAHVVPGCHPLTLPRLLHLIGMMMEIVLGEAKDGYPVDLLTR